MGVGAEGIVAPENTLTRVDDGFQWTEEEAVKPGLLKSGVG